MPDIVLLFRDLIKIYYLISVRNIPGIERLQTKDIPRLIDANHMIFISKDPMDLRLDYFDLSECLSDSIAR